MFCVGTVGCTQVSTPPFWGVADELAVGVGVGFGCVPVGAVVVVGAAVFVTVGDGTACAQAVRKRPTTSTNGNKADINLFICFFSFVLRRLKRSVSLSRSSHMNPVERRQ